MTTPLPSNSIYPSRFHCYLDYGLCPIPIHSDGTKSPAIPTWKEYQTRLPTQQEATLWALAHKSLAIVCGVVSWGLEVLDFDQPGLFELFSDLVPHELLHRLPMVCTPRGGWHLYYRCSKICASAKIATALIDGKCKTLIETRGEGGYVIAVGSNASTHASGLLYQVHYWPNAPFVPTITEQERDLLWRAAATFDRSERRAKKIETKKRELLKNLTQPRRPTVTRDDSSSWSDILTPYGWTSPDGIHWRRPGKDDGISAKVNTSKDGTEVLTVFSTNAGPLSPDQGGYVSLSKMEVKRRLAAGQELDGPSHLSGGKS